MPQRLIRRSPFQRASEPQFTMYSNVCLQLACNRAAAHMKTGAYGDALADCDAALQMDPEYTKVRVASTQWLGGCCQHHRGAREGRSVCVTQAHRRFQGAQSV